MCVSTYLPRPSLQGDSPPDTYMGSRVLLSQDLSASKFSMIILETIHYGPKARHSSARPSRGRYSRGCPRPPPPRAVRVGRGGRRRWHVPTSPDRLTVLRVAPQAASPPAPGAFLSPDPGPG